MEIGELESKVLEVIKGRASDAVKQQITLDTPFDDKNLNFDSLDSVELLMELEDAGIVDHKIPDNVAHTLTNGRKAVEYASGPADYIAKYQIAPETKQP